VYEEMLTSGETPKTIVEKKELAQISDYSAIETLIDRVLADFPGQVEQFKSGKEKVFGFLVGQVMRATRGKANPALLNEILRKKLNN
jgi:aspartyl-tRNA(Asn)/glutamyl-tRNA(Gln) amidotransferase subunit B